MEKEIQEMEERIEYYLSVGSWAMAQLLIDTRDNVIREMIYG